MYTWSLQKHKSITNLQTYSRYKIINYLKTKRHKGTQNYNDIIMINILLSSPVCSYNNIKYIFILTWFYFMPNF